MEASQPLVEVWKSWFGESEPVRIDDRFYCTHHKVWHSEDDALVSVVGRKLWFYDICTDAYVSIVEAGLSGDCQ